MLPQRKRLRWAEYDYGRPGAYFITICTWRRQWQLGEVEAGKVRLSTAGALVQLAWDAIPSHSAGAWLDTCVIMPDHMHGILVLDWSAPPLGQVVNLFKGASTREINRAHSTPGAPLWQRGFHERIIRDDEWDTTRSYITANPMRWEERRRLRQP